MKDRDRGLASSYPTFKQSNMNLTSHSRWVAHYTLTKTEEFTMIYRSARGKMIGEVSDHRFSKKVKKSKHLLRKWDAWGIDKTVLDTLASEGVQDIVIHEAEEDMTYSISVKEFAEKGIQADFGH